MKDVAVDKQGNLRTYYTFKSTFKKELHLKVIKNSDIRKCFTQFKLSAHHLAFERGRYEKIKSGDRIYNFAIITKKKMKSIS